MADDDVGPDEQCHEKSTVRRGVSECEVVGCMDMWVRASVWMRECKYGCEWVHIWMHISV